VVSKKSISAFKPLLTNLAQTSQYQVVFGGLPINLQQHLNARGVSSFYISEDVGLMCSSASLPGSSFGTADIVGNFMGVTEKIAHTRLYTQIELEFYIDNDYKVLKFLEHWMEFISGGSGVQEQQKGYYYRMSYPDDYKCNQTKIIKFERDYKKQLEYTFIGMFPLALNATAVNYGNSEILKATATFNYDRYLAGKYNSLSVYQGSSGNKQNNNPPESKTKSGGLKPVSPGAGAGQGVSFIPQDLTYAEALAQGKVYNSPYAVQ